MSATKRMVSILLCLVLLLSTFYVAKTGTMPGTEMDLSHDDKDSLVVWYTDDSLTDYVSAACVSFNEKYGIRVVPRLQTGDEYLEEINRASINDEGAPDLYLITNDMLERAYLSGLAYKIQDNNGMVSSRYFSEAALESVTYKDKLVAYPLYFETSALIYNKTYLEDMARNQVMAEMSAEPGEEIITADTEGLTDEERAYYALSEEDRVAYRIEQAIPKTFDELMEFANTCDAPPNVETIFKWDVKDIFYNYFFVGNYVDVGGASGDSKDKIDIYNMDAISALQVYQDMNQFFSFEYEDITYESVLNEFMEGKLVFTTATSDAISKIEEAKADGLFEYEFGSAPIPDLNDILKSRSMSVTNTVAINGYSDKKETANEFARYLTIDYASRLYEMTGRLASATNVKYADEAFTAFVDEYANSVPVPKLMAASNYWLLAEITFANVWAGKSVSKEMQSLSEQIKLQITGLDVTEEYIEMPSLSDEETEYFDEEALKQEAQDEDKEKEDSDSEQSSEE